MCVSIELYESDRYSYPASGAALAAFSVVIRWVAVLAPGLFVVTALAKAAPVASIPEERRISPVRNDVVDHRCFDVASFL